VSFAALFHWLDRSVVAGTVREMLESDPAHAARVGKGWALSPCPDSGAADDGHTRRLGGSPQPCVERGQRETFALSEH
jgi:hypothetical protein